MKKTIKKKINKFEDSFEERIKKYSMGVNELAIKLELRVQPIVNWKKRRPNLLGKVAIYLLKLSGAILDTQYTNTKK